jgi:hypothetical protein
MLKWKPVSYNEPAIGERVLLACDDGKTYGVCTRTISGSFFNGYEEIAVFGSTMCLLPRAKYWLPFPECPLVKSKPTTLDKFGVI